MFVVMILVKILWTVGNLSNKAQDMIIVCFLFVVNILVKKKLTDCNKAVMGDSGRDRELKRSRKTDRA